MKLKLTHPASAFLKQAHSRAKIISKVIHQPAPDSLTQTTMSACTDGAIHCSEGNIDVICGDQEGMNFQIAECEWEQPGVNVSGFFQTNSRENIKLKHYTEMITTPSRALLSFRPLKWTGVPLRWVFFGPRRSSTCCTRCQSRSAPVLVQKFGEMSVFFSHPRWANAHKFATVCVLEPHTSQNPRPDLGKGARWSIWWDYCWQIHRKTESRRI